MLTMKPSVVHSPKSSTSVLATIDTMNVEDFTDDLSS